MKPYFVMVGLSSPPSPPRRHPRRFLSAAGVRKVAWWRRFRPFYKAAGPVRPSNRQACTARRVHLPPAVQCDSASRRSQLVISDCIAGPPPPAHRLHRECPRQGPPPFQLHTAPRRDQSSSLSITIFFFFFFFGAAASFASCVLKEISHFSRGNQDS